MTSAPVQSTRHSTRRHRDEERQYRALHTQEVLDELSELDPDDATQDERRQELRDELVRTNMGVARSIAARYRNRGIADDDLEQVAYLALVRVTHVFEPTRGHDFMSYAVPSIRGEVLRHFRDQGWMVRPPRRVQELQGRISAAESELSTSLGHPPSPRELAEELGEPDSEVREALAANGCFSPTSIDQVVSSTDSSSIGDQLGEADPGLAASEARVMLRALGRHLTARERRILQMRFFGDCTQQEIADEIGVTQMQVSRLLSGILGRMRQELEGDTQEQAAT